MRDPFRYFNSSPKVIRLVGMMYVKYPLSLRNVEDLLAERGIDISHETVRFWWNRFGPLFAAEIRKKRVAHRRRYPQWRWHLDEVFVKVNGKLRYLWRAVDHEGEVVGSGSHREAGQGCGAEISQAYHEEVRATGEDRH
jgi:putative transposase